MYTIAYSRHSENGAAFLSAFMPFLSKDAKRPALDCVAIKDGAVWATDGHKALTGPADKLDVDVPDGTYKIGKSGKDLILMPASEQLPNIQAVMPKTWEKQFEASTESAEAVAILNYLLAVCGVCINPKMLEALPGGLWTVGVRGPNSPVHFHNETFRAVIMTIRTNDSEKNIKHGAFSWEAAKAEAVKV